MATPVENAYQTVRYHSIVIVVDLLHECPFRSQTFSSVHHTRLVDESGTKVVAVREHKNGKWATVTEYSEGKL